MNATLEQTRARERERAGARSRSERQKTIWPLRHNSLAEQNTRSQHARRSRTKRIARSLAGTTGRGQLFLLKKRAAFG